MEKGKRKRREISNRVLLRDRDLYRKIAKCITFEEKLVLLDFEGSYWRYQRNLFKIARRHGIEVQKVR